MKQCVQTAWPGKKKEVAYFQTKCTRTDTLQLLHGLLASAGSSAKGQCQRQSGSLLQVRVHRICSLASYQGIFWKLQKLVEYNA